MGKSLVYKISWLWGFIRPLKLNYTLCVLLMIIQSIVSIGTISVQKWIVDDVFVSGMYEKLPAFLGGFTGLFILLSILYVLVAYYTFKNNGDTQTEVSKNVLTYLQYLSISDLRKERIASYLYYYTNDSNLVSRLLAIECTRGFQNLISLILLICALWMVSPILLIPCLLIGIYYFFVGRLVMFKVKSVAKQVHESRSKLMVFIEESISATREIVAFNREKWESKRFNKYFLDVYDKVLKEGRMTNKQLIISEPAKWGIHLTVLGFGGIGVMQNTISLGMFIVGYQLTANLMGAMQNLFNFWMDLSRHWASVERLHSLLDGERIENGHLPLRTDIQSLSLCNVSFSFSLEGKQVLDCLSMDIPMGKKIAIVGTSGSGKSTISQLLIRFFEPQAGSIKLNGLPFSEISREDWKNRITIVFQEPYLFPDTIRTNLLLGLSNISEEKIIEVCVAVNIHKDIMKLPNGYQTVLGERGITFSGGQRQRIALARAMLRDTEILILDEATSALDLETERQVIHNINERRIGKTTIIIAHRLSTIQDADKIFVLNQGRIVEQGTHNELMGVGTSLYKQLVLQNIDLTNENLSER